MNDDIWSKQFYKALEAVGKLTVIEKLRLASILIAVSDIKEKQLPQYANGVELYKDDDTEDKVFSFENKKLHSTII